MSPPTAVLVSFRLGGTDGVSVEARKWEWALRRLGFVTRRVAGELTDGLRPDDTWLPSLAIAPVRNAQPEPDALAAAIGSVDLVVVENVCSLPLNVDASSMVAGVLSEHKGRVLFHHHDLPWERPHLAHLTQFPPRRANSLHVTINDGARRALAQRGIDAVTVRNAFDLHPHNGDRRGTRATFGFATDDIVVLQPTRAIPRKEVGRGLAFAEQLAGIAPEHTLRYWLTGPAEDGFDAELERLVSSTTIRVVRGRAERPEDAYAASDIVVFPSSWEGFGNPVVEAIVAERPVATAWYPVLDELRELGLHVFSVDAPQAVAEWLRMPDPAIVDANRRALRESFDLEDLPGRIATAFTSVAWDRW